MADVPRDLFRFTLDLFNPTALITVLEGTAEFEDVHFSAPTTRDEGESAETFSIVAKVHGGLNLEKPQ